MTAPATLVLGTRRSPLALAQARGRLPYALGWAQGRLPLAPMVSTGDRIQDRPLAEAGAEGPVAEELDEALLAGRAAA